MPRATNPRLRINLFKNTMWVGSMIGRTPMTTFKYLFTAFVYSISVAVAGPVPSGKDLEPQRKDLFAYAVQPFSERILSDGFDYLRGNILVPDYVHAILSSDLEEDNVANQVAGVQHKFMEGARFVWLLRLPTAKAGGF